MGLGVGMCMSLRETIEKEVASSTGAIRPCDQAKTQAAITHDSLAMKRLSSGAANLSTFDEKKCPATA